MKDMSLLYGRIACFQEGVDPTPPLVCFFGDSNTCGWGRETIQHREVYPARPRRVARAIPDLPLQWTQRRQGRRHRGRRAGPAGARCAPPRARPGGAGLWQEDATALHAAYRGEADGEIQPRLHALSLLREGHTLTETARLVGVHYVTLQTWVAWYRRGGLAEVRRHKNGGRQGRASHLNSAQIARLRTQAQEGHFRTAADVQEWLRTTFGVAYSMGGIYNLLARLRWKPKAPRPQSITTSPAVQEAWEKGDSPPLWSRVG